MSKNTDEIAIDIIGLSKSYIMYPSNKHLVLEAFGFLGLFPKKKKSLNRFTALKSINLKVKRGEKIGIIGRNGAGKSTLLKLITGNFTPTTGTIQVNGSVQALMQTGLGFHYELSGRENIRSSLLYNNLSTAATDSAEKDIIEFCELGEFIDYPIKTYSLGMLSRLQFACATAIHPDILIVDEILGAGDAYFSGKSAYRMEKLTNSGCTLLLVSHSMTQILQFCDKAIWMEDGEIVSIGKALDIVKSYEEYINHLSHKENQTLISCNETTANQKKILLHAILGRVDLAEDVISRWVGTFGLKIKNITLLDANLKITSNFNTFDPFTIRFQYYAQETNNYNFIAVAVIFTDEGKIVTRFISQPQTVELVKDEFKFIDLYSNSLTLGNGEYILSVALYKKLDLKNQTQSEPFDLLSRCFKFKVTSKDRFDPSLIYIAASWRTNEEIADDIVS